MAKCTKKNKQVFLCEIEVKLQYTESISCTLPKKDMKQAQKGTKTKEKQWREKLP